MHFYPLRSFYTALSFSVCHDLPHPRRTTHAHKLCNTLCVALLTHTATFTHTHSHTHSRPPTRHRLLPRTHPRTQAVLRYTIQAKNARGKALALIIDQVTTLIHLPRQPKLIPSLTRSLHTPPAHHSPSCLFTTAIRITRNLALARKHTPTHARARKRTHARSFCSLTRLAYSLFPAHTRV